LKSTGGLSFAGAELDFASAAGGILDSPPLVTALPGKRDGSSACLRAQHEDIAKSKIAATLVQRLISITGEVFIESFHEQLDIVLIDAIIEVYIRAWIFAGGGLDKRAVVVGLV